MHHLRGHTDALIAAGGDEHVPDVREHHERSGDGEVDHAWHDEHDDGLSGVDIAGATC